MNKNRGVWRGSLLLVHETKNNVYSASSHLYSVLVYTGSRTTGSDANPLVMHAPTPTRSRQLMNHRHTYTHTFMCTDRTPALSAPFIQLIRFRELLLVHRLNSPRLCVYVYYLLSRCDCISQPLYPPSHAARHTATRCEPQPQPNKPTLPAQFRTQHGHRVHSTRTYSNRFFIKFSSYRLIGPNPPVAP